MKKRDMIILVAVISVVLIVSSLSILTAQSVVTWEGILPGISTELGGTDAINIAMTASTVGLDVSEETALTNTVNGTIKSTHTTSGTPANNIGNGYWVYQETSAANTEKIMELNAVVTDATAASEDAKLSVELMAAGAASAEVFSISSVGAGSFDAGLIVNEDGDDSDFRVESDNITNILQVDASTDAVQNNGWVEYHITNVESTPYSIGSTGRDYIHAVDYTTTGAVTIQINSDVLSTGRKLLFYDEDGNANTNNITISTGGAETINGSATYVMDADSEAVELISDGSNWFVIGGFGE